MSSPDISALLREQMYDVVATHLPHLNEVERNEMTDAMVEEATKLGLQLRDQRR